MLIITDCEKYILTTQTFSLPSILGLPYHLDLVLHTTQPNIMAQAGRQNRWTGGRHGRGSVKGDKGPRNI